MEENAGDGSNSSVAELEVRVETLEGTAADHETRISAAEADINGNQFSNLVVSQLFTASKRSLGDNNFTWGRSLPDEDPPGQRPP